MRMLLALPLLCLPVTALQAGDPPKPPLLPVIAFQAGDLTKPPPVVIVLPAPPDYVRGDFCGRVVARGEETITIKPEGNPKTQESFSFYEGGIKEHRIYLLDDPKEPQTFVFSNELHWHNGGGVGAPPPGGVMSHDGKHKIDDLRCGDLVWIWCCRINGIDYCTAIHIGRRPGGKVPPAIGDAKTESERRVDTQRNAEQACEEMLIATFRRLKVLAR